MFIAGGDCRFTIFDQKKLQFRTTTNMLRTVLLLDGSSSINSSVDYLPSRLLALRPHVFRLVDSILDSAFAAQVAVAVMRDGVAHKLCGLSNNAMEIAGSLEKKYFMFGGAGCMSLENGLRLALSELVTISRHDSAIRDVTVKRIIVVCSSVTSVDHSDIFTIFDVIKRHHISVDVLSICGATHLTSQLAHQTGGRFVCPMNYDQLRDAVSCFIDPPEAAREGPPAMLQIAIPKIGTDGRTVVCSRCLGPLSSVPSTCAQCKVLVCSLPYIHSAFAKANKLAPSSCLLPATEPVERSCAECNAIIDASDSGFRCDGCGSVRCSNCETFIRTVLHACPTCVGAA